MANPTAPKALVGAVTNCPANVPTNACDPSYTTTGADHRSYRVDTYLYFDTPSYGNQLRTVTVVVRNPADLTRTLRARHLHVRSLDRSVSPGLRGTGA